MDYKPFLSWENVESALKRSKRFSPQNLKKSFHKLCFFSIHVIGTNGKGSVSYKIAYALEKAGFKVGLLTSPHLECVTERIQINRKPIDLKTLQNIRNAIPFEESWYMHLFLVAIQYFQQNCVDFVVFEAGMGARLDPIRLIDPFLTVITSIGYDHTQDLGNTLEKIALEKGALFTKDLVISSQALTPTILTLALKRGTNVTIAQTDDNDYQSTNTYTALKAIEFFKKKGIIPFSTDFKELYKVVPKGRFEEIKKGVILDVAHNPQGLEALIAKCRQKYPVGGILIIGGYKDKDLVSVLKGTHEYFSKIFVCDLAKKDPRMLPQETLKMQIETITKREVFLVEDPFKQAYLEKDEKNLLLVCGGFQMVKEAKKRFKDFPDR